jgi:hypothetical protein
MYVFGLCPLIDQRLKLEAKYHEDENGVLAVCANAGAPMAARISAIENKVLRMVMVLLGWVDG